MKKYKQSTQSTSAPAAVGPGILASYDKQYNE